MDCRMKFFIALMIPSALCALNQAITYNPNGGRLGDDISTYAKTKLLSYQYDIPLLYKPFTYSNCFALDHLECRYTKEKAASFAHQVIVKKESDLRRSLHQDNTLFICTFYTKTQSCYQVMLKDPFFAEIIEKAFTPLIDLDIPEISFDTHTVAMHIRLGGGFDSPLSSAPWAPSYSERKTTRTIAADIQWPTKFPPLQYYYDQLVALKKRLPPQEPLLVYLLTDDQTPEKIVEQFRARLQDPTIQFWYRTTSGPNTAVIEDLFIMSRTRYLIRSSSLFAQAAQLLGKHELIYVPQTYHWDNNYLSIDTVAIIQRPATS